MDAAHAPNMDARGCPWTCIVEENECVLLADLPSNQTMQLHCAHAVSSRSSLFAVPIFGAQAEVLRAALGHITPHTAAFPTRSCVLLRVPCCDACLGMPISRSNRLLLPLRAAGDRSLAVGTIQQRSATAARGGAAGTIRVDFPRANHCHDRARPVWLLESLSYPKVPRHAHRSGPVLKHDRWQLPSSSSLHARCTSVRPPLPVEHYCSVCSLERVLAAAPKLNRLLSVCHSLRRMPRPCG
jgi:hypothetical protein